MSKQRIASSASPALGPDDELYQVTGRADDKLAPRLGVTPRMSRRLIDERCITFVRIGRRVFVPESAVREYLAARLVEAVR
ncbi:MAG: excisionase family DNA-binding protein [Candidatus Neomicrothrix subdominans]